jgi:hypothetical protein
MKTIHNTIILVFIVLTSVNVNAQKDYIQLNKWSIDYSAFNAAYFKITQVKVNYTLNPNSKLKSEIGLGLLLQPGSTAKPNEVFNTDGIYSAKMATVAYRRYLWKGLHIEEDFNFGQGALTNNVTDGKSYKEFVILSQTYIGYKLDFWKKTKYNLFIMGQGGFAYAYNTNHWPTVGSPSFFGLGDLKIGINF